MDNYSSIYRKVIQNRCHNKCQNEFKSLEKDTINVLRDNSIVDTGVSYTCVIVILGSDSEATILQTVRLTGVVQTKYHNSQQISNNSQSTDT